MNFFKHREVSISFISVFVNCNNKKNQIAMIKLFDVKYLENTIKETMNLFCFSIEFLYTENCKVSINSNFLNMFYETKVQFQFT